MYGSVIEKALRFLGEISLYLWLMHRVFLYEPVRTWTLQIRIPVLIVAAAIVVLIPFAVLMRRIDRGITGWMFGKG